MSKRFLTISLLVLVLLSASTLYSKDKSLRLTFIIDKENDEQHIYDMFNSSDPAGLESRARSMGFDIEFAKRIKKAKNYETIKNELRPFVDKVYEKEIDSLKRSQSEYTNSWKPIIRRFSNQVVNFTDHPWFYSEYLCVVSAFHPGISDWYGNKVVRKYNEDPIKQRWTTAFEIVLSHIFHIVREDYSKDQLADSRVWAFSEITTSFILQDPKMVRSFWPWKKIRTNYFSKSNYPQLAGLEEKLRQIWGDRKDFHDYLSRSVPVLVKFTQMNKK